MQKYNIQQDKRLEFYFRVYSFIKIEWFDLNENILNHKDIKKANQCKYMKIIFFRKKKKKIIKGV